MVAARPKLESMRIVTGCKTADHFIAVFHRFCDATTCFIPTTETRPVGSPLAFSLRLADGTPMIRGTCVVKQAWTTADNKFKRPGVQLEITRLAADSHATFEQMLAMKSNGIVAAAGSETTNQHVPRDKAIELILRQGNAPVVARKPTEDRFDNVPTVRVATPVPIDDDVDQRTTKIAVPAESRAPGSAIVLPANPLTDLDDDALDELLAACTVADDGEPLDDDLAIPVLPPPPEREPITTLIGVAPLRVPTPFPLAIGPDGTRPLALPARTPGPAVSRFRLHAMTAEERTWFLYAIGVALLVAAIVLASAVALG